MLQIAKRLTILFALFLALIPALVLGQASFEAQVRGVVHDATGSVIIGAKVTIIEKGARLIALEDEDVSNAIQEILQSEGIQIRLNAECISARREGERIVVGLDCAEAAGTIMQTINQTTTLKLSKR